MTLLRQVQVQVQEANHLDAVNVSVAKLNARQLEALKNTPSVAYVEADPIRYLPEQSVAYGITMGQAPQVYNAMTNFYNGGMLLVAAAGNAGISAFSYPASYNAVMSVAVVNSSKVRASFSQYNSQVAISGPGVSVNSTNKNKTYSSLSGTSMASPHVAGVAALDWSQHRNCSAAKIRAALNATAEERGTTGRDTLYGWGIVQAKAAVDYLYINRC